jgi:S1-C subfamily serine protease
MRTVKTLLSVVLGVTLLAGRALAAEGGYLGVYLEDETAATRGAYVTEVAPDSPADRAGIKGGDLVTGYNGEKIANSHALIERLEKAKPGESVTIRLERNSWEKEIKVSFGRREGAPSEPRTETHPTEGDARGFLGAYLAEFPEGPGALVTNVVADSPAQKAGLKKGDVVTGVNGKKIGKYTEFQEFLHATKPGQKIQLRVSRDGWEREVPVELGHRAADKPAPPTTAVPAEPATPVKPVEKKEAYLGVALVDNDGRGPLKVDDVAPNSPAEKVGIKPGDVIVAFGERAVKTIREFDDARKQHFAGEKVKLSLERDGFRREVDVVLGEKTEQ